MDAYDMYLKNFDAEAAKDSVVSWIRSKMNDFGPKSKCVIGISGGKDSSIAAALCVEAIGRDRVYGVMMPNGNQPDIGFAEELIATLGIHNYLCNILIPCREITRVVELNMDRVSETARINMPARMRMLTLYMVAQTLGNAYVVNTCNLSEDWVGYSTWHGDSAGDFSPLAHFTSDEVVAIGDACGLPHHLTHKTPSDGLCGKTDEDNLGFTYRTLNKYLRLNSIDKETKARIDMLHLKNKFKLQPLDSYQFWPWDFQVFDKEENS